MIVRLKEASPVTSTLVWLFQFYDSPIKRQASPVTSTLVWLFQFYDSPIKRSVLSPQIHADVLSFNSMIVRLKVKPV